MTPRIQDNNYPVLSQTHISCYALNRIIHFWSYCILGHWPMSSVDLKVYLECRNWYRSLMNDSSGSYHTSAITAKAVIPFPRCIHGVPSEARQASSTQENVSASQWNRLFKEIAWLKRSSWVNFNDLPLAASRALEEWVVWIKLTQWTCPLWC